MVCLICACFGNEVAFFEKFLFFFLTCCLLFDFRLALSLISVIDAMRWLSHERLVLTGSLLFSGKMVGCSITVGEKNNIGNLRFCEEVGWCLKKTTPALENLFRGVLEGLG